MSIASIVACVRAMSLDFWIGVACGIVMTMIEEVTRMLIKELRGQR